MTNSVGCSTSCERQGLLDNTVVIITSDHGEAFGDHGHFGHSYSLYLDEIGVPLVILSPAHRRAEWWTVPSACATCRRPWSTCWGSRPARRSRAARWRPTGDRRPGRCPRGSPPQPSRSRPTRPRSNLSLRSGRGHSGFQMSLVASGHHYIRDGMGAETLYDLRRDPFERVNLMGSPTATKPWESSGECSSRC